MKQSVEAENASRGGAGGGGAPDEIGGGGGGGGSASSILNIDIGGTLFGLLCVMGGFCFIGAGFRLILFKIFSF